MSGRPILLNRSILVIKLMNGISALITAVNDSSIADMNRCLSYKYVTSTKCKHAKRIFTLPVSWLNICFNESWFVYNSTCPGISITKYWQFFWVNCSWILSFSHYILSSKNYMQYIMPPLGPSLYSSMASCSVINSYMLIPHSYSMLSLAGSRLIMQCLRSSY